MDSESKPKRGCAIPILPFAVLGLVALFGAMFYFLDVYQKQRSHEGDYTRYDPYAVRAEIEDFAAWGLDPKARPLELVSIRAEYVKRDGTMDLSADYEPTVYWTFAGAPVEPKGPPGTPGHSNRVEVMVHATDPHWETSRGADGDSSSRYFFGLWRHQSERDRDHEVVPWPTCTLTELWEHASAAGAPADGVARIRYDAKGYWFDIEGSEVSLRFGMDCQPI